MNILNKVTWKAMWRNRTRTLVTIAGIILSAAMFCAVTTLAVSLQDFLIRGQVYKDGDYFIQFDYSSDQEFSALKQDKAVTQVADYQALGFVNLQEKPSHYGSYLVAACDQTFFNFMPVHLQKGRLPENSSEILVPDQAVSFLEQYASAPQLGEALTLDVVSNFSFSGDSAPEVENQPFTKTYTVVGIYEGEYYNDYDLCLQSFLTVADGKQEPALWHRLFAKTVSPEDALDMECYGPVSEPNYNLLRLYGTTAYGNYNRVFISIVLILIAIIMVGSVSLIYNAFSISVSERTKQFGLLSSIGATRRQLRRSVFFEAGVLCLIGIPLGLLCGWGGIAVVLSLLGSTVDQLFSFGINHAVTLRAVLSPVALLGAAAVSILTILISAWIPARRATRITPMDAIRQTGDYKTGRKDVKVGKLTYKVFGLPGVLAKKYYKTSRKKYRATVISLTVSIILFLSATTFATTLRSASHNASNVENFDIVCESDDAAALETVRKQPGVSKSAYVCESSCKTLLAEDQLTPEYRHSWENGALAYYDSGDRLLPIITIHYLEDAVLEQFLKEQKLDPAPYLNPEDPLALVCQKKLTVYLMDAQTGERTRKVEQFYPLVEDAGVIPLYPFEVPEELLDPYPPEDFNFACDMVLSESREPMLELETWPLDAYGDAIEEQYQVLYYRIVMEGGQAAYYPYDPETDTMDDSPAATMELKGRDQLRLGARIETLPYGISQSAFSGSNLAVILPLSFWKGSDFCPSLSLSVSDYQGVLNYLDSPTCDNVSYGDYLAEQENARGILLMVNVFSYGFIILISLISAANVFNTISTNIALRRRDFGMLRSVGLRGKELYRMMDFECLIYGSKALLLGLPMGILCSYGIHKSFGILYEYSPFTIPWLPLAIAAGSVFLVVFASMLYAVTKLRKDNPIDAIRAENL